MLGKTHWKCALLSALVVCIHKRAHELCRCIADSCFIFSDSSYFKVVGWIYVARDCLFCIPTHFKFFQSRHVLRSLMMRQTTKLMGFALSVPDPAQKVNDKHPSAISFKPFLPIKHRSSDCLSKHIQLTLPNSRWG